MICISGMVIVNKSILVRSPQLFFDQITFIHFIAAHYLISQNQIKFKILSQTPWIYTNSFVSTNIKIILFNYKKKVHFCKHIVKRYKNYFVQNHFKKYMYS